MNHTTVAPARLPLRLLVVFLGMVLGLAVLVSAPGTAHAGTITVGEMSHSAPDPRSVTFRARVTAPAGLRTATLDYKLTNAASTVGGSRQAEVNGSTATEASITITTNGGEIYIPIGANFVYTWTFVDADGARVTTPSREFVYLDGRYQWQNKTSGHVTVYWAGNESHADLALKAATSAIEFNESLLKVKLDFPVRLVVWRNRAESQMALLSRGQVKDSQTITWGARVAPDVLHVYEPNGPFVDTVRHEITHVMTKIAGDGPFAPLPSWVDEGTAVYSQVDVGDYEPTVRDAIRRDSLLRLRTMAGEQSRPELVNLHYGQSWAVVKYLIDKNGRDKFAELYKVFRANGSMDAALKQLYGVDQDGLYNEWRVSVGLKAIDFPPEPTSSGGPQAQGTRAPLGFGTPGAAGAGQAAGSDAAAAPSGEATSKTLPAVLVGLVTLALVAAMGFGAFRLMRKTKA